MLKQPPPSSLTLITIRRWMAGYCLSQTERAIVDQVLRENAIAQFARCFVEVAS